MVPRSAGAAARTLHRFVLLAAGWCWLVVAIGPASAAGAGGDTGAWDWPLDPRPAVLHGFDPPAQPWLTGHRGVDLAGMSGQRVLSAGVGEVSYAGRLAGVGIVVVRHGELRTTYQPVRASVALGASVRTGDVIGRLEEFGSHCAPDACLHWGLLRGITYLDPLALVHAGPPRLLPLYDETGLRPTAATPLMSVVPANPSPAVGSETSERTGRWALAAATGATAAAALIAGSAARRRRRSSA